MGGVWQVWMCEQYPSLPPPPHLVLLHCGPPAQLLIDLVQLKLQTCDAIGRLRHSKPQGESVRPLPPHLRPLACDICDTTMCHIICEACCYMQQASSFPSPAAPQPLSAVATS